MGVINQLSYRLGSQHCMHGNPLDYSKLQKKNTLLTTICIKNKIEPINPKFIDTLDA